MKNKKTTKLLVFMLMCVFTLTAFMVGCSCNNTLVLQEPLTKEEQILLAKDSLEGVYTAQTKSNINTTSNVILASAEKTNDIEFIESLFVKEEYNDFISIREPSQENYNSLVWQYLLFHLALESIITETQTISLDYLYNIEYDSSISGPTLLSNISFSGVSSEGVIYAYGESLTYGTSIFELSFSLYYNTPIDFGYELNIYSARDEYNALFIYDKINTTAYAIHTHKSAIRVELMKSAEYKELAIADNSDANEVIRIADLIRSNLYKNSNDVELDNIIKTFGVEQPKTISNSYTIQIQINDIVNHSIIMS